MAKGERDPSLVVVPFAGHYPVEIRILYTVREHGVRVRVGYLCTGTEAHLGAWLGAWLGEWLGEWLGDVVMDT